MALYCCVVCCIFQHDLDCDIAACDQARSDKLSAMADWALNNRQACKGCYYMQSICITVRAIMLLSSLAQFKANYRMVCTDECAVQVSVSGQAVVFVVRTLKWSLASRAGLWTYLAFFLAQVLPSCCPPTAPYCPCLSLVALSVAAAAPATAAAPAVDLAAACTASASVAAAAAAAAPAQSGGA